MYFLSIFIVFQVLSNSFSFDIEMEGVFRLGEGLTGRNSNKDEDVLQQIFVRSQKLPKKFSRANIMRANSIALNRTDELIEYIKHTQMIGEASLNNAATQIIKKLNLGDSFTLPTEHSINDYIKKMEEYLQYIISQKARYVIDEEMLFLNIVESACRLLYSEHKQLLNIAIMAVKTSIKNKQSEKNKTKNINDIEIPQNIKIIQNLSQYLYKQAITTKRQEMRHICNEYEVCRPYPAFTDYFADFIVELLRLSEKNLEIYSKLMNVLVYINEETFKKIIENEEINSIIVPYIQETLRDTTKLQKALLLMRSVIVNRFNMIESTDLKLKLRTQAVRIILDIINKAFQYESKELMANNFDSTVKNMRIWNINKRQFPEISITQLTNLILNTLETNLSKRAKLEINVLVETVLKGSSNNEDLFKTLFSEGSKYLKGDDIIYGIKVL